MDHPLFIGLNGREGIVNVCPQPDRFPIHHDLNHVQHTGDDRLQPDRLKLQRDGLFLQTGDVDQIVQHKAHPAADFFNDFHTFLLLRMNRVGLIIQDYLQHR
ncbi:hypothetical protein D3C74_428750 [compost metagenome]